MLKNIEELEKEVEKINAQRSRTYWGRGVSSYTAELLDNIEQHETEAKTAEELRGQMLNGAESWDQYSWGGCSLCYDWDICQTLATPSEQKRTRGGELRPNSREEWLDTQARALTQAAARIVAAFKNLQRRGDKND